MRHKRQNSMHRSRRRSRGGQKGSGFRLNIVVVVLNRCYNRFGSDNNHEKHIR